jgi:DNA-binding beta-propeller fold protein YncE
MIARLASSAVLVATMGLGMPASASGAADPVPPRMYYVSGFGESAIRGFPVQSDGWIGGSTEGTRYSLAQPMSEAIVFSPDGRRVYVTDRADPGSVEGFSLGEDGGLTALPGSPYPTGGDYPVGLAFSPDGRRLFATNYNALLPYTGFLTGNGSVTAFDVAANGSLERVPGPATTDSGGLEPIGIVVSPDGRRLYVTHNSSPVISMFDIAGDGRLTSAGTVPSGAGGADGIAIAPDGRHLYVGNTNNQIVAYELAPGAPPRRVGSPVSTEGLFSISISMTRDGRQVWASNLLSGTIRGFGVGPDGTLSPLPGGPVTTGGTLPQAISFSPDLSTLYVANRGSFNTTVLRMAPDGRLTQVGKRWTGVNSPGFGGATTTPGFSPAAALASSVTGRTASFSAAGSSDPDGTIAKYDWDFGDGTSAATTTPSVHHEYDRPGTYRASVTVTDDDGCAADPGFTGVTAGCAGAARARVTTTVTVVG